MPRHKLSNLSMEQLQNEIRRRQMALPKLIAERDALDCQIAELQSLGGAAAKAVVRGRPGRPAGKAKRAKNTISLADALAQALKGKQSLGVAEAVNAVLSAGYKTTSKTFKAIVNKTLLKDKRIKNVGRGRYALKG